MKNSHANSSLPARSGMMRLRDWAVGYPDNLCGVPLMSNN